MKIAAVICMERQIGGENENWERDIDKQDGLFPIPIKKVIWFDYPI